MIFKYVVGIISSFIMILCGYGTSDFMSTNQKMIIDYVKASPILMVLSVLLFGPLDEGVTLSLGIIQSISYVTMGMLFSYIYYKTDNIFISVGLHILNNLLSVIAIIGML